MSMGYLNRNEGYGCVNQDFVNEFPKIAGVAGYNVPPQMALQRRVRDSSASSAGVNIGNVTTRPTFIINDMVTWTQERAHDQGRDGIPQDHGKHPLQRQPGGNVQLRPWRDRAASASNSGSPVASFLLGAVDNGGATFRDSPTPYPRQHAWIFHAGDSWRVSDKLTLDYGLRWDYYSPSSEKNDVFSFLDPTGAELGSGRPAGPSGVRRRRLRRQQLRRAVSRGQLVRRDRAASGGGLQPQRQDRRSAPAGASSTRRRSTRAGAAVSRRTASDRRVVQLVARRRASRPSISIRACRRPSRRRRSSVTTTTTARASCIGRPTPTSGPYAHQWNVTVDRELASQRLAERGVRRQRGPPTAVEHRPDQRDQPVSALDGQRAERRVRPGPGQLDGVAAPYAGWAQQLMDNGCAPSVAQALSPVSAVPARRSRG